MNNNISPMLRHALESFEHGIYHYLEDTEIGRKFAFLHVDQSIELTIKEKLIRLEKTIYKENGTTLTIHEAFNSIVKDLKIPERARLEELHDIRNNIQHKGLSPDKLSTEYYINHGYKFMKRFLKDELEMDIVKLLPSFYSEVMEKDTKPPVNTPEEVRKKLQEAEKLFLSSSYEMSVVLAFIACEEAFKSKYMLEDKRISFLEKLRFLIKDNRINDSFAVSVNEVIQLKNSIIHLGTKISKDKARIAIDILNELVIYMQL